MVEQEGRLWKTATDKQPEQQQKKKTTLRKKYE